MVNSLSLYKTHWYLLLLGRDQIGWIANTCSAVYTWIKVRNACHWIQKLFWCPSFAFVVHDGEMAQEEHDVGKRMTRVTCALSFRHERYPTHRTFGFAFLVYWFRFLYCKFRTSCFLLLVPFACNPGCVSRSRVFLQRSIFWDWCSGRYNFSFERVVYIVSLLLAEVLRLSSVRCCKKLLEESKASSGSEHLALASS